MKKKTVILSQNQIILPIAFVVISLLLEVLSFLLLSVNGWGGFQLFPSKWLFDVGGVLIIAGILYLVRNKKAMLAIFYVCLILQTIICIANINIYKVFGDIFTVDYFVLGEEALAAIRFEFLDFVSICVFLAVFALTIVFTTLLFKKNKKVVSFEKLSVPIFMLIMVLFCETFGATLYSAQVVGVTSATSDLIENNTSYLYESFQFKTDAYKEFGYYGFYAKNVIDAIFGSRKSNKKEIEELKAFIEEGKTQKADLDNRFENDNLIVLLCESNEWFAYDPINTPFVWNLINGQAATFTNFYGHNKTNISEGIVVNGNLPQQNSIKNLINHSGFDYAYSLPKLFKEAHAGENTQVNYFHTWKRTFYDRYITYLDKGFGFDNYYSVDYYSKFNSKFFGDWVCDSDFVEEFADEFVPQKDQVDTFFSFFATMSTHGSYTYENPRFEDHYAKFDEHFEEYQQWLENFTDEVSIPTNKGDFEQFRRYKVGAMEFDRTVAKIFQLLEERDRLNDTTVVLFADHNTYYDNLCYKVKGVDKTDYSNIKVHNIPLVIYNSKLEANTYDFFCNTYDVFPTIASLHGLCYNKNLVHGYNLFSEEIENSFFASHLGGMFNDEFYSKNISDVFALQKNLTELSLKKFKEQAENYYQKQKKLEKIYINNLAV